MFKLTVFLSSSKYVGDKVSTLHFCAPTLAVTSVKISVCNRVPFLYGKDAQNIVWHEVLNQEYCRELLGNGWFPLHPMEEKGKS